MNVYLLWHSHEMESGAVDSKLIGVYSTEERAEQAKQRSLLLPGFRDLPGAFIVDRYEVDQDNWTTGYATALPENK
jgi:hypothetical protein